MHAKWYCRKRQKNENGGRKLKQCNFKIVPPHFFMFVKRNISWWEIPVLTPAFLLINDIQCGNTYKYECSRLSGRSDLYPRLTSVNIYISSNFLENSFTKLAMTNTISLNTFRYFTTKRDVACWKRFQSLTSFTISASYPPNNTDPHTLLWSPATQYIRCLPSPPE